jgi:cation diffusion facilitator family transporter
MDGHDLAAHAHHEPDSDHNRSGERRTRWVVGLTAIMMIGELTVGWLTGSMALTADGWHMGTHVGALGLTLLAYWYARTRAGKDTFSFGTGKVYALAGYTSGVLLALVAVWMVKEGIERLVTHPKVDFGEAIPIAALGLVVNIVSAILLGHSHTFGHDHSGHDHDHHDHHDHHHDDASSDEPPKPGTLDFNLRAAYIHIVADALTSVLAIAALTAGKYGGLWFFDPAMGLVGGAVITWWAVGLCRQASRQLLDVVSSPTCERVVRDKLEAIDDVRIADLHVWDLGPGRRSVIVSIVTARPREVDEYRRAVLDALDVAHLTIEIHRCELPHHDTHEPHDHADDVAHVHAH